MNDMPENPGRDELRERYEKLEDLPSRAWVNYGDANPAGHGGNWITYDPDTGRFEMIGTFPASEVGFEYGREESAHWVYRNEAYISDIITEDGDFTDPVKSTLESLRYSKTPAGAVEDGRMTWLVVAFLDERRENYRRDMPVYEGEYEEILEKVGVQPR